MRKKRRKKIKVILGIVLGVIILAIIIFMILPGPVSKSADTVEFSVKKGEGKEKIV